MENFNQIKQVKALNALPVYVYTRKKPIPQINIREIGFIDRIFEG